jgi:hypothetical protein
MQLVVVPNSVFADRPLPSATSHTSLGLTRLTQTSGSCFWTTMDANRKDHHPCHQSIPSLVAAVSRLHVRKLSTASCEAPNRATPPFPLSLQEIQREKQRIQAELDRLENAERGAGSDGGEASGGGTSCASCLYTGVATCAGLATYFAHLGCNDAAVLPRHRPFLLAIAAGWTAAGTYRWKLG